jgi:glycosyltransferase involved in cell wall biosynthesis
VLVRRDPAEIRVALRQLAADEAFRRKLSAGARKAGRREFGIEPFVEAYEQLYREARVAQPIPVRP